MPLCEGASRVVPGEGDPGARLVLVGEAPGASEDRDGRPFVGRAGRVLDSLLADAGLRREELWITNAVKCRPTRLQNGMLQNRAPTLAEIRAWVPCLNEELSAIAPSVVIGLGAIAGRALVGKAFHMTHQRGHWLRSDVHEADILVTWHPAYVLRYSGAERQRIMAEVLTDLKAAVRRLREI